MSKTTAPTPTPAAPVRRAPPSARPRPLASARGTVDAPPEPAAA
ncbi:MAG TPA: hypothetical protein VGB15_06530 [Longimicrobium sp.]